MNDLDALDLMDATTPATPNVTTRRAKPAPDPERQRRNRTNRKRGRRTSSDLADYLGGQDVESLNWPWDVQGDGYRIQSKRLAEHPSNRAIVGFIEAIPFVTRHLRGFYLVEPFRRLESGRVFAALNEWVEWHGWTLPDCRLAVVDGAALIEMPLPVFRDVHVNAKEDAA